MGEGQSEPWKRWDRRPELKAFEQRLDEHLHRLHEDRAPTATSVAVDGSTSQRPATGRDASAWHPGDRGPGLPAGAAQSARAEVFEPLFDDSSFGYRRVRSAKDRCASCAEIEADAEWIVTQI